MSTLISTSSRGTVDFGRRSGPEGAEGMRGCVHDHLPSRPNTNVGSAQANTRHSAHSGSNQGTVEYALLTAAVVAFMLVAATELLNLFLSVIAQINAWVLTTNLPTLASR